jgi:hypothetical protein
MLPAKGAARVIHIPPNGDAIEFDEAAVSSIWQ